MCNSKNYFLIYVIRGGGFFRNEDVRSAQREGNSQYNFAQWDVIDLSLAPCALDQSCFSRGTYPNQSLCVKATKAFIWFFPECTMIQQKSRADLSPLHLSV